MLGLLVAGSVVFVVGLLAIGFGIPVKEFSFGNTLILSGAILACTGAILIGLSFVLKELKIISSRIAGNVQPETSGALRGRPAQLPSRAPAKVVEDRAGYHGETPDPSFSLPSLPEHDDSASTSDQGAAVAEPQPGKQRRNLLFTSTRREREAAAETPHPGIDAPVEASAAAEPPGSFDDAWPEPDRLRSEPVRRPSRQASIADVEQTKTAATPMPVRRPAESPPVTILKSGVVDGMAYSLYSDGSIEAQLPEGMVRFASIDELRSHLDHRE